jgi:hypothetical protein
MCWSKNNLEERDAPNQILIGVMDPFFLHIAVMGNISGIGIEKWIILFKGYIYFTIKAYLGTVRCIWCQCSFRMLHFTYG